MKPNECPNRPAVGMDTKKEPIDEFYEIGEDLGR